jgi:RHS repeat-associated protein
MVSTLTADGMRIEKVTGLSLETVESEEESSGFYDEIWSTNKPTTRYFYDGQMCAEDDQRIQMGSEWDPDVIVTRYGIGARGIDFIGYTEAEQPEVVSFPIYDGHGNMVATVKRDGTGFTCGDRRAYDAWGNIRQQTHSGYPEQRYCANLGHREDSESGLTYMRARYYEPWTGRFLSEDPARYGPNFFIYASNNCTTLADPNGCSPLPTDTEGWMRWIIARYGDFQEMMSLPQMQILQAGASACSMLALLAARVDTAGNILSISGLANPWIASIVPWLPGLLISMGSVARLAAGGMRIAATLIGITTLWAFLIEDAY